eukprot:4420155-Pyramimonas_sp.AAC.1
MPCNDDNAREQHLEHCRACPRDPRERAQRRAPLGLAPAILAGASKDTSARTDSREIHANLERMDEEMGGLEASC